MVHFSLCLSAELRFEAYAQAPNRNAIPSANVVDNEYGSSNFGTPMDNVKQEETTGLNLSGKASVWGPTAAASIPEP